LFGVFLERSLRRKKSNLKKNFKLENMRVAKPSETELENAENKNNGNRGSGSLNAAMIAKEASPAKYDAEEEGAREEEKKMKSSFESIDTATTVSTTKEIITVKPSNSSSSQKGDNNITLSQSLNTETTKRQNRLNRLIADVEEIDFAAPPPAWLRDAPARREYVLEPGPKDGSHSRCRIVRKRDAFGYCTYVLYADYPRNKDGMDEARALCAARKRKKSRRSRLVVSLDVADIRESSTQYLGKVAAMNAAGTCFELFDDGVKPGTWETFERSMREDYEEEAESDDDDDDDEEEVDEAEKNIEITNKNKTGGAGGGRNGKDVVNTSSDVAEEDDNESSQGAKEAKNRARLGKVEYNLNPLGINGPRQMRVEIINTESMNNCSKSMRFKNVLPTWNKKMRAYCLNFNGRVTQPSVKNFQLLLDDDGDVGKEEDEDDDDEDEYNDVDDMNSNNSSNNNNINPPLEKKERINENDDDTFNVAKNAALSREKRRRKKNSRWTKWILQFGKIGDDVFTMDFRYPFTPLQAFMVCATSLDKKLGCE
jgi:hypothetical protein